MTPELTSAHRTQLSQFLERCDRVKFAGYRPDSNESIDTLAAAQAWTDADPYVAEGVFARVTVQPFRKVFPQ